MAIQSVNPATEVTLRTYEPLTPVQLEEKLERTVTAFDLQRKMSRAERAKRMAQAGSLLVQEKKRWAKTMVEEMGKPITGAMAEVEKCAWVCRYYAENADRLLADEVIDTDGARSFTRCLPLGTVLAVMPWNFPFWQVFRFAAPALVAGNVGLLKHAPTCRMRACHRGPLFRGGVCGGGLSDLAGREDGSPGDRRPAGAAATLTGSDAAGSSRGRPRRAHLKKTVLELGGSDPFIVIPSADLAEAAGGARARTSTAGSAASPRSASSSTSGVRGLDPAFVEACGRCVRATRSMTRSWVRWPPTPSATKWMPRSGIRAGR